MKKLRNNKSSFQQIKKSLFNNLSIFVKIKRDGNDNKTEP